MYLQSKRCRRVAGCRRKVLPRRHRLCRQCLRRRPSDHDQNFDKAQSHRCRPYLPNCCSGAFICLILAVLCFFSPYHGVGHRIGEASNPGPRHLSVCSLNITSLRLHLPSVAQLPWDILCAQETGCTSANIGASLSFCQEAGIQLFHGPLLPASQAGGVAICSKAYHLIKGLHAHSGFHHHLLASSRWKHVMVPLTRNRCLNLHSFYGFTGSNSCSNSLQLNESLLQSLFLEISQVGDAPALIMGDCLTLISASLRLSLMPLTT
jgi:hypothetical protein